MSPRFCIAEQHGAQFPKYRVIDDMSRSEASSTACTSDTYCPQDLYTLFHARALTKPGAENLRAWSVDFSNAYKTIGIREASSFAGAVCFVHPADNFPYKARTLVQPFGSRRAPENWGRVVTFLQFVARELRSLTVSAFADDIFSAEPATTATSGFCASKRLVSLLGFHTSGKMAQPPTTEIAFLGALVTLGPSFVRAAARPERITKLLGQIAQAPRTNCLTPASASNIRGSFVSTRLSSRGS